MSGLWSSREAAQCDYEQLRQATLDGVPLIGVAARRFARRGLPGLIAWPSSEPVFDATLVAADRPAWTPHTDPRIEALAGAYSLLLTGGRVAAANAEMRKVR